MTSTRRSGLRLLLAELLIFLLRVEGFQPVPSRYSRASRPTTDRSWNCKIISPLLNRVSLTPCFETSTPADPETPTSTVHVTPSFWRPKPQYSRYCERVQLKDLKVGQQLSGHIVGELLEARTGPKLFFECGVGSTNSKGEWRMVNGMLRLDRSKLSVAKKRAARIRKKDRVDLYVSRIQAECGRLEVCADLENVKKYKSQGKVSVSSLKPGQEVIGEVVKLHPYGVMVNVGANRLGLLHIQKVADLYDRYIHKEQGLEKFGLERGARIKLVVSSNEKKRLALDFTDSVKEEAAEERAAEESKQSQAESSGMSVEELASWGEFASKEPESKKEVVEADEDDEDDDDEDDEDYDDYDEQRDIEDQLGLGGY